MFTEYTIDAEVLTPTTFITSYNNLAGNVITSSCNVTVSGEVISAILNENMVFCAGAFKSPALIDGVFYKLYSTPSGYRILQTIPNEMVFNHLGFRVILGIQS